MPKHARYKITTPTTCQVEPPEEIVLIIQKRDKRWAEKSRIPREYIPWDTLNREEKEKQCDAEIESRLKSPDLTSEELQKLDSWYDIHHDPKYSYWRYNRNVSNLGRPTVVAYVEFKTYMGQQKIWLYKEDTMEPIESGETEDAWADYPGRLCLMSNNEIWFYFYTSKRESQKRKPKYLAEIKEMIREWQKERISR